jgi:hypothetical protein
MALLAMLWGVLNDHGVWYPVNLLAAGFFPDRGTPDQLAMFHWSSLIMGTAIHVAAIVFIGLLYGAVLPMVPRHPVLLAGTVVPLFTSALAHSILGTLNPRFSELIDWPWFVACQVAFGTVAGLVVSRRERLPTWQHRPFRERAGLESDEAAERDGGADA